MWKFIVSETYLLKGAPLGDVDAVGAISSERTYAPGDVLVEAGDESRDLFVILEGRLQVLGADGTVVAELRKGAIVGEIAFLDGQARTAKVVAPNACKVLDVPYKAFREMLVSNPKLASVVYRNMAQALAERLRTANVEIESLRDAPDLD